jgi:hypothetical protein
MGWLLYVVITIMSSYLVVNDNDIIAVIIISDHDIINHNVLHEWGFPNSWGYPKSWIVCSMEKSENR